MVILEYVCLEILEVLIAERTAMVAVHCFFDAMSAVHMPTARDVAICDRVQTDRALELML